MIKCFQTDRRGADDQLRLGEDERLGMSGQYNTAVSSSSGYGPGSSGHSAQVSLTTISCDVSPNSNRTSTLIIS